MNRVWGLELWLRVEWGKQETDYMIKKRKRFPLEDPEWRGWVGGGGMVFCESVVGFWVGGGSCLPIPVCLLDVPLICRKDSQNPRSGRDWYCPLAV